MPHDQHSHVKVSIITVVYNAADKIEPTILSVLGQDYDNLEYIVIDGGSTDGTRDVIDRYRERITVVVSERDDGLYDALNKGIRLATGKWIGVMNAGDVFASDDVLWALFGEDSAYDGCDVVYGDAIGVDGKTSIPFKGAENISMLEEGPCYRHGASFVRRDIHKAYPFDLEKKSVLGFALDYEQIFRMYKGGCSFRKVPITIMKYELRGASTISPFKATYYNYLITHRMRCNVMMKLVLVWLTLWRGLGVLARRYFKVRKHSAIHEERVA